MTDDITKLIKDLKSNDYNIRETAKKALAEIGGAAVGPLLELLKDTKNLGPDLETGVKSSAAISALGHIGGEEAVDALLNLLFDENLCDENVNLSDFPFFGVVVEALGKSGDERAVEPLVKLLEDSTKTDYQDKGGFSGIPDQTHLADALGELGDKRAVEPLVKMLNMESGERKFAEYTLPSIAEALGKIGDARAVEPLIEVLGGRILGDEHDRDNKLYTNAAEALGKIDDGRAVDALIKVVRGDNWRGDNCAYGAAKALELLGWEPETAEHRVAYLISKGDWDAVVNLGETAVEPLINLLEDEREIETHGSFYGAGGERLGPKFKFEQLGDLYPGPKNVREAAALALKILKWKPETDELRVAHLLALRGEKEENYRDGAVGFDDISEEFDALGESAMGPLIKTLKKDNARDVRLGSLERLIKIGEPAVEPLIIALGDDDSGVRSGATDTLGIIGDRRAVEPLITNLKGDKSARFGSARALGKIGDKRAVEPLIEAFKNENVIEILSSVVAALAMIGDKRAVEPLIEALGADDEAVRLVAAGGLGRLLSSSDVQAIEPLIKAMKDAVALSNQPTYQNTLVRIGVPAVEPVAQALLESDDETLSEELMLTLIWMNNEVAFVRICGIVEQGEFGTYREARYRAIEYLGGSGDVRAVGSLLSNSHMDETAEQMREALYKWCMRADPRHWQAAPTPLAPSRDVKQTDSTEYMEAISYLIPHLAGHLLDQIKPEVLIKILEEDGGIHGDAAIFWEYSSKDVFTALGDIGDKRAIVPITKVWTRKGISESSQKAAAEALDKLGWEPDTDELRITYLLAVGDLRAFVEWGEPAIGLLTQAIEDENPVAPQALAAIAASLVKGKEKENILRFLESDDPAMVLMGASLLKGAVEK